MKPIFLIGFMGCGKSTIGGELSKSLDLKFKDTDHMVERNQGQTIPSIFKEDGEDAFRNYESKALCQSIEANIISTGGGIIQRSENIDFMKSNGMVIYLQTSFDAINKRLKNDPSRPLWDANNINDKMKLFEQRLPFYERYADFIVQTDNKQVDQIVQDIKNELFMNKNR